MWKQHNENPINNRVGDCVIRAISTALNQDWVKTYADLCVQGLMFCDLPSSNAVWGSYLAQKGYKRSTIPNACNCYTVENFCKDHPQGTSYARGRGRNARRDRMGRYSSNDGMSYEGSSYARDGYPYGMSYDGAKEHLMDKAEEMLEMTQDPKERRAIEKFMRELED